MTDTGSMLLFIIAAFSLAVVLILKKDTIQGRLKRPLALIALVMVCVAFFLIVYSFFIGMPK